MLEMLATLDKSSVSLSKGWDLKQLVTNGVEWHPVSHTRSAQ